ncbi:MAG: hypothetical protein ACFCUX_10020 [Candidatus Methylacidiphilales bacterium]
MKTELRPQWVQIELKMDLPRVERIHRQRVKQKAGMIWDAIQKQQMLISTESSKP